MALDGECIKQDFFLVANNPAPTTPTLDLPASRLNECCFELLVLADTGSSDEYKNDVNGFLFTFNKDFISTTVLSLQKYEGGAWVDKTTLANDTYGTFYTLGSLENNQNETFTGYKLSWKSVLTAFGQGDYRIKCVAAFVVGTATIYSWQYCLKPYTQARANSTVRLEWYMSGKFGDPNDDTRKNDYSDFNWYDSIRLEGWFGFPSSQFEDEYTQYDNGRNQKVIDEQEPEYELQLKAIPHYVHDLIRINVLQSDQLLITDYNTENTKQYLRQAVYRTSGYEPQWQKMQSKKAPVNIKFKQEYNNLKKLRC